MVKIMVSDQQRIAEIVQQVLQNLGAVTSAAQLEQTTASSTAVPSRPTVCTAGKDGVFTDIQAGVAAAKDAQRKLAVMPLKKREEIIAAIRQASIDHVQSIACLAHEETGYGRIEDKVEKKLNAARLTPGVEDLKVDSTTGDGGLILVERAPFGVVASIEPATHPGACIINHAISMIAAGNSIVFLPHPRGIRTAMELVKIYNQAIVRVGGPANLVVVADRVGNDVFDAVINHPDIDLVVATGGPFVVEQAMKSGKKAIGAGPGNPPVVVDETVCDLAKAARDIVAGAGFDNTVLCIAEKVIIAVDSIADELMIHLEAAGTRLLREEAEKNKVIQAILPDGEHFAPDLIGKDASVILRQAQLTYVGDPRLIVFETDKNHSVVMKEQLLPVIPLVRVPDFTAAMALAVVVEQGFKHTAVIHSQDVNRITEYAKALKVDILVANGPSFSGLAVGAEGHYSHTIASPTGEGICTPKTYTREQRTVLVGSLFTI